MDKNLVKSTIIELFNSSTHQSDTLDNETIKRIMLDIDVSSALDKISRGIASRKVTVIAKDLALNDQAKEIEKRFSSIKFNRVLNHLITARYFGYSCFEIVYKEDFSIQSLIAIPAEYVQYQQNVWAIQVGTTKINLDRTKFLLCINAWNPATPKGKSIFSSCQASFLDKELYKNQLRGLAKKYGDVIVVFPYDENQEEKDVREQAEQIKKAKGKNVIGVPVGRGQTLKDSFQFIKLADLDPNIYTELEKNEKQKLIQKLLGGTLTIGDGEGKGSYALANVHQNGLDDVLQEVAQFCCDSLYQLIENDSKFFGYNPEDFYFNLEKVVSQGRKNELDLKKEEITKIKIENIANFSQNGYNFSKSYISKYLGVDEQDIEISDRNGFNGFLKGEFSQGDDTQKKIEEFIKFDAEFQKFMQEKFEKFSKNIQEQILEQMQLISSNGEFTFNLDYSMFKDDFILSQISGYAFSRMITQNIKIDIFDPFNMPFQEAIKSFLDKTPIMYEAIEEITEEVRANFAWIKKSTDLEITNKLFKNLQDDLQNGGTLKTWISKSKDVIDKAGLGDKGYYLENVYRTNLFSQYSIGNYKQLKDVVKSYPVWEYHSIMDNRTSNICRTLNGRTYPADDTFWDSYFPPNHYQCRATVIARKAVVKSQVDLTQDEILTIDKEMGHFKGNPAKKYWEDVEKNANGKQKEFVWE